MWNPSFLCMYILFMFFLRIILSFMNWYKSLLPTSQNIVYSVNVHKPQIENVEIWLSFIENQYELFNVRKKFRSTTWTKWLFVKVVQIVRYLSNLWIHKYFVNRYEQLITLIHPKGTQSWIFIGRTDAEAETPVLWPSDAKNWFIWKDPDAGKDWRQEEKGTTEDEMVGWHHPLNGYEF